MPEGHSVTRLARQFRDVFLGKRLQVSSPQGRFSAGAARIDGETLVGARAHGKQMFLEFSNDLVLRVHLGLYGAWSFGGNESFTGASSIGAPRRIGEREAAGGNGVSDAVYTGPPPPVGAVRVRLVSDSGWADLRGPTACEVITAAEAAAAVGGLGPDPLHARPADQAEFLRRIGASSSPIATLLMKQEVLAGVGNVYRAEALFRQRLNPLLPGSRLDPGRAAALWQDIAKIMLDGVHEGRIVTTLPEDRDDDAVPVPQTEAHYVYKRTGLPCRICGTAVVMAEHAGRKLYWCPNCQAAD
ncbi:MAG: formamidopyrimidine-DNA glycosylase [Micrococcaceae bacterium]|nr:formamidopyrimidine-DNA glycosylase [Micrococcaceae bacterium]